MGGCNPCNAAGGGGGGSSLVTAGGTSGTATPGQAPEVTITYTISPVITSGSSATFQVGNRGSFTISASGVPAPSLSEAGALPSGVSFTDNGDGTAAVSGTPAAGSGGTYPLTLTASNGISPDASQNFTLTVQQAPSASITRPANGATYAQGQVVSSNFSCSEGAGGPGIKSCLDQNGHTTGAALDTSTPGQHTFTVTATSKDGLTGGSSVTYTVSPTCQDLDSAYDQGFNSGFNNGFNSGFSSGFRSGFTEGFGSTNTHGAVIPGNGAAAVRAHAIPAECDPQFNQGFNTGFNVGFNSGFNSGFNIGFTSGFSAGFNAAYRAKHHTRHHHKHHRR
jgi:hypothetical protein